MFWAPSLEQTPMHLEGGAAPELTPISASEAQRFAERRS